MPTLKYPPGAMQRVMGSLYADEQQIAMCDIRLPLLDQYEPRPSEAGRCTCFISCTPLHFVHSLPSGADPRPVDSLVRRWVDKLTWPANRHKSSTNPQALDPPARFTFQYLTTRFGEDHADLRELRTTSA